MIRPVGKKLLGQPAQTKDGHTTPGSSYDDIPDFSDFPHLPPSTVAPGSTSPPKTRTPHCSASPTRTSTRPQAERGVGSSRRITPCADLGSGSTLDRGPVGDANGIIIPNKSTIAEEIDVPRGRESGGMAIDDRERDRDNRDAGCGGDKDSELGGPENASGGGEDEKGL